MVSFFGGRLRPLSQNPFFNSVLSHGLQTGHSLCLWSVLLGSCGLHVLWDPASPTEDCILSPVFVSLLYVPSLKKKSKPPHLFLISPYYSISLVGRGFPNPDSSTFQQLSVALHLLGCSMPCVTSIPSFISEFSEDFSPSPALNRWLVFSL